MTANAIDSPTMKVFQVEPVAPSGETQLVFDDLLDLPVTLSVEVGRSQLAIRELLQLTAGSVVQLDHSTSEPFDVLINGTLLARGEAVVVDANYGVRLTNTVGAAELRRRIG